MGKRRRYRNRGRRAAARRALIAREGGIAPMRWVTDAEFEDWFKVAIRGYFAEKAP
jgi:hypothetical protein